MFKKFLLCALVLLSSGLAQGQSASEFVGAQDCRFFSALTAGTDRDSTVTFGRSFNLAKMKHGSFQVVWADLTGVIDGVVKIQVSTNNVDWTDKTGATFTLSGAAGNNLISLSNIAEQYAKVVYTKNGVTGGTINGYCNLKG